jgi:hypothetical protein
MSDEIDLFINQTLAMIRHDFIDGDLVESQENFDMFMLVLLQSVFPHHQISVAERGTIVGKGSWHFTVGTEDIFQGLKPFSPGQNRDLIVKVLGRELIRRDTFNAIKGKDPYKEFDSSKLILVPKMKWTQLNKPRNLHVTNGSPAEIKIVSRPAFGDVHCFAAINEPTHLMYVPKQMLPAIGISEDDLFKRAMKNLKDKASEVTIDFDEGLALIGNDAMDGMASQLIFDPEFWMSLSKKVDDGLFIHVVQDSEIVVCKLSDEMAMFELMSGIAGGEVDALLPDNFFTCDDKGFRLLARRQSTAD